jgi:potassium inwardly-rectifying channel subfamily J
MENHHRLLEVNSTPRYPTPRILPRDAPFHQSNGRLNIKRSGVATSLYWESLYHTIVHRSTWQLVLLMTLIYFVLCVTFAVPLYLASDNCGMGMTSFYDALYFSLETMATIGYGLGGKSDPFFDNCTAGFPIIFLLSVLSILYDAVCLGLIFNRISRINTRASTIVFSNKAIIRFSKEGVPFFMFQVCEMRKHQLVEAHARCYAFLRPLSTTVGNGRRSFLTKSMRLVHPDDALSGFILLAAPSCIVHRIDHWSPMCPPSMHSTDANGPHPFPSLIRRAVDQEIGCEDKVFPPSESRTAAKRNKEEEVEEERKAERLNSRPMSIEEMKTSILHWMEDSRLEVLCLVEGIESISSGTLQCRHSYSKEDILFDHEFEECVWEDDDGAGPTICFEKFHHVNPVTDRNALWKTSSHLS